MPQVPIGTKFVGISANVPTPENRSSQNNAFQDVYTLEDIGSSLKFPFDMLLVASDESTPITAGTSKVTFRMPCLIQLLDVRASLTTAQSSGNIFTVDIRQNGVSIFDVGFLLTIDNNEKTSLTAINKYLLATNKLDDDDEIAVDVTQIGNGTATGLKITIIGTREF
jgi:hypothetical protein